jgi:hypothetical protein
MDRAEKQLRKFKDKVRDNKHKTPTSGGGVTAEPASKEV